MLVHDGKFKPEYIAVCDGTYKPDDVMALDKDGVLSGSNNVISINDGTSSETSSLTTSIYSENSSLATEGGLSGYSDRGDSSPHTLSASRNSLSGYLNEYAVSFEFGDHSSARPVEDADNTKKDGSGYATESFTDHHELAVKMDELPSCESKFIMGVNGYVVPLDQ